MRTLLVFRSEHTLRDKLLGKLHSVTGPQHQTSATCKAKFSIIARKVAEKIAWCNRAFIQNLRLINSNLQFLDKVFIFIYDYNDRQVNNYSYFNVLFSVLKLYNLLIV